MPANRPLDIFVVSDGTGTTAEAVLTAVVVQFEGGDFNIRRFPFVRTEEEVREVVRQAPRGEAIIVFTLVSSSLRGLMFREGQARGLTVVDVMGPLISKVSSLLQHAPKMVPGALRHEDEEMYRLTEAIHFTLLHDDGLGLETLGQADLIILGLSRTGKTPTSIYLSCKKLKVANIPIVHGIPFPREIARLPVKKVGFRMSLERLFELRTERVSHLSSAEAPGYSSKSHLLKEENYCEEIYERIPSLWTIDVTKRSIEETSEWITRNVL